MRHCAWCNCELLPREKVLCANCVSIEDAKRKKEMSKKSKDGYMNPIEKKAFVESFKTTSNFVKFKTMSEVNDVWINKNQVRAVRHYDTKETKIYIGYVYFIVPHDVETVLEMLT